VNVSGIDRADAVLVRADGRLLRRAATLYRLGADADLLTVERPFENRFFEAPGAEAVTRFLHLDDGASQRLHESPVGDAPQRRYEELGDSTPAQLRRGCGSAGDPGRLRAPSQC
jgi:hypothetical protein